MAKVPADHLDTNQALAYLGICRDTLSRLIGARRIACVRVTEGKRARLAFRQSDLDAYLASNRIEAQPVEGDTPSALPLRLAARKPRRVLDLPEAKRYA